MKEFVVTDDNIEFVKACQISPDKMKCAVVTQTINFTFRWRNILQLLFGAKIFCESKLYCQNDPGKTWSEGMTATIKFEDK